METTHQAHYTTKDQALYLALELGEKEWKLAFTIGLGQPPRRRVIEARDRAALEQEIAWAKERFGLAAATIVRSCYEAGREGFWLHRYLRQQQIENLVVDSASIETNRRKKRPKTDRLDARKLVMMLVRYHLGEKKMWSVVRVPSVEAEDNRQLHRELLTLKAERTSYSNRISGLLATQGAKLRPGPDFLAQLAALRLWNEQPVPPQLRARLEREYTRWQFLHGQVRQLEQQRRELLRTSQDPEVDMVRRLLLLRSIGENSAWPFVVEFFGWREFRNRREVGSLAGLTPTPRASGQYVYEQGIDKAGNWRIRALAIEIAWAWLRYQPQSELSRWYEDRFGASGKRMRKLGIVALARKLLIALWRYLEEGLVPAGAQLKT